MASKPDYALIKPSADELEPLSNEVLRYTCEGKCIIITSVIDPIWLAEKCILISTVACNSIVIISM